MTLYETLSLLWVWVSQSLLYWVQHDLDTLVFTTLNCYYLLVVSVPQNIYAIERIQKKYLLIYFFKLFF
jgi:hypothetical protein